MVLLAFALVLVTESVVLIFTQDQFLPVVVREDRDLLGAVYGLAGLALLGIGAYLQTPDRHPPIEMPRPGADEGPALAAPVEVKRTKMEFAPNPVIENPIPAEEERELERLNQRLAQLKVQYGLGALSQTAYKELARDLEARQAELERRKHNIDA